MCILLLLGGEEFDLTFHKGRRKGWHKAFRSWRLPKFVQFLKWNVRY